MGKCYITRRGTKTSGTTEQLGIYPIGEDGRPTGDVVVPEGVKSLYRYIFDSNKNVSSVKLPTTLENINNYAFYNCTSLQKIDKIPDFITKIETSTFQNCSSLEEIDLNNCYEFDVNAFNGCTKLKPKINTPVNKVSLGNHAFFKCSSITDEFVNKIGSNIGSHGSHCFEGCTSLQNIEIKFCNDNSFYGCTGLKTVKIEDCLSSLRSGSSVFYNCTNLETINYGETCKTRMTRIESNYCYNCSSLKSIELPTSLTTIDTYAFKNCSSLTSIVIPDGVITIGYEIFSGCTALKDVYLPSTITKDSYDTFTSSNNYMFKNCTSLENVRLGQDWNLNLRLDVSENLTVDSIVAMFNSLKDLTGDTAKTLTLGSTNLAKLTDEQKAIAINKNWTLA